MVSFGSASGSPLREVRDPSTYTALVYAPPDTCASPVPMLLYLHGAGECGSKIWGIIAEGATGTPPVELHFGRAPPALAEQFCVVAPQSAGGWQPAKIAKFCEWLLSGGAKDLVPAIDPNRCYCTGHSMGGSGALDAGTTGLFAAIAPVAPGGGDTANLKGVPCWLFHGANDVVLPVRCSERAYEALRSLNGEEPVRNSCPAPHMALPSNLLRWGTCHGATGPLQLQPCHLRTWASCVVHCCRPGEEMVKFTCFESAPDPPGYPHATGHASTIPAYATTELYSWLLSHVKKT